MKMHHARRILATALMTAGLLIRADEAQACGGMFCDGGPSSMPVDQKGENILFVMDGETVEAHIQIQYKGNAHRFAWVLPVQSLPVASVGSQLLFDALLQGTVPTWGFSTKQDCPPNVAGSGGAGSGSAGSAGSGGGGPTVVYQATVGAYDVSVLQGGTADEVVTWLDGNGYQQSPDAAPVLQKYLEKSYLFLAIKLTGGADTDSIHPLVIKYHGTEPCVPLQLTAIAAVEDMGVRTFFLGKGRWVPTNYKHVTLNEARFDWVNRVPNYNDVVAKAADSPVADGHAFITEYAGSSKVVPTYSIYPGWKSEPFVSLPVAGVVEELKNQGLMTCSGYVYTPDGNTVMVGPDCVYQNPLLQGIVNQYIPVPAGMTEVAFYNCLSCNQAKIDVSAWDGAAFSQAMSEKIVDPAKHAVALLQTWPYLTRMYTEISPVEMGVDPEFHERADLPPVASGGFGVERITCDGARGMTTPDTRDIALDQNNQWPTWTDEMPWAESIEEYPAAGDPIVLVSNTAKIDKLVTEWNVSRNWPPVATGAGGKAGSGAGGKASGGHAGSGLGGSGVGGSGVGGSGVGGSGDAGSGVGGSGTAGSSEGGAAGSGNTDDPGGGGCAMGRTASSGGWVALALLGLGLSRRRRR